MRSLLSVLLLLLAAATSAQDVDESFCRRTRLHGKLPTADKPRFWTNLALIEKDRVVADISVFADTEADKMAVNWFGGSEHYHFVQNFGTGQLVFDDSNDRESVDSCVVTQKTTDEFNVMTRAPVPGKNPLLLPSRLFFTGDGLLIDKNQDKQLPGVVVSTYSSCFYWNSMKTTMELTWYFPREAGTWPIAVKVRGKPTNATQQQFEMYFTVHPPSDVGKNWPIKRNPFMAPTGVYCPGLLQEKVAVPPTGRFHVSVERRMLNSGDTFTFEEAYDQSTNITSILGDTWINKEEHKRYGKGSLIHIHDFTRGISYVRNRRYGNCTFAEIPRSSWDVNQDPNGLRLKTPAELFYPSIQELQFKGSGVFRSRTVDAFIGYKPDGLTAPDGTKLPMTIEYYLAYVLDYAPGGQRLDRAVPLYIQTKSPYKYYNSETQVFSFNTEVLSTDNYDVSACFEMEDKAHYELLLPLDELDPSEAEFINDNHNVLVYWLSNSLARALNISPLRIIRPVVTLDIVGVVLVELTITERATVPNYTPQAPEAKLQEAAATLRRLVAAEQLSVSLLKGDIMLSVPVLAATSLDQRSDERVASGGMSAGAAVGLSFGMLLLGALVAVGALLLAARLRNRQLLGDDPFSMRQMQESSGATSSG